MTPKEARDRQLAHNAFSRAVRRGELVRQPCEHCAKGTDEETIHGHHFMGYAKKHRLTVMWLCGRCHFYLHAYGKLPRLAPMTGAERRLHYAAIESLRKRPTPHSKSRPLRPVRNG